MFIWLPSQLLFSLYGLFYPLLSIITVFYNNLNFDTINDNILHFEWKWRWMTISWQTVMNDKFELHKGWFGMCFIFLILYMFIVGRIAFKLYNLIPIMKMCSDILLIDTSVLSGNLIQDMKDRIDNEHATAIRNRLLEQKFGQYHLMPIFIQYMGQLHVCQVDNGKKKDRIKISTNSYETQLVVKGDCNCSGNDQ